MQINSIRPMIQQSFKGNDTEAGQSLAINVSPEEVEFLNKLADKVNSNVHPGTIIATLFAAFAVAKSASKIVPIIRKGAVTFGESVAKIATNITTGVANKFKKGNKIDTDSILESISKKADALRDGTGTKFVDKLKDTLGKIFDPEKVDKAFNSLGITTDNKAVDVALAGIAGYATMDPVSDTVEQKSDEKDILEDIAEMV